MITPEEWQRVKRVTTAARDHPEADRAAFVAAACGGDAGFERQVLSLLASVERAPNLFETPAIDTAPRSSVGWTAAPPLREGSRVGPYHIVAELGRGGMGMVFLAERADQRKATEVLTSLLRAAPDDPELLRAAARTAVAKANTLEQAGRVGEALVMARHALWIDERLRARDGQ